MLLDGRQLTAGATGIGLELARKVFQRGATVVVLCHHEPKEKEIGIKYYVCDVSDRETVTRVAKVVREEVSTATAGLEGGRALPFSYVAHSTFLSRDLLDPRSDTLPSS